MLFSIYIISINLIGYLVIYEDKKRAKKHQWRIPEATLLGISLLGGSIGTYAGMNKFRHKTKHPKFTLGVPIIIILQLFLLCKILF